MATFEIQRLPGAPKQQGRLEPGQRMIDWLDGQKLHSSVLIKLNGNELDDDFDIGYRFRGDDHLSVFDQPQNMGALKTSLNCRHHGKHLTPLS